MEEVSQDAAACFLPSNCQSGSWKNVPSSTELGIKGVMSHYKGRRADCGAGTYLSVDNEGNWYFYYLNKLQCINTFMCYPRGMAYPNMTLGIFGVIFTDSYGGSGDGITYSSITCAFPMT